MDVESDQGNRKTRTSKLLQKLFRSQNINSYLIENSNEFGLPKFHEHISMICTNSNLIPEQVIKQSAIERTYGHQLFNGTRNPSRDKIIQLAFGLKLNVEETQNLLKIGGRSLLYPKIKRDAAILYCISHHLDIYETQSMLENLELTLLSGEHS